MAPTDAPLGESGDLYAALHDLARGQMRREPASHTLQPTALVHEAYLKLGDRHGARSPTHFKALAAQAMRRVLVDHARRRRAGKRGGEGAAVTLYDDLALGEEDGTDALDLERVLTELAENDARKARVVELRFFAGLSIHETAQVLAMSPKTVEADWYMARAWLRRRLKAHA